MTSRLAQARAAVRPALKARLMISGPTGAGKTWTALKIAEVLAEGGKILVIDTEKESALTYADNFTFVHLPWLPPFDPRELGRTLTEAGHEYAAVIVDSTSHFWRKEGGTLDIAGGKFTGWKDARPAQEDLVQALLDCHAHVIFCARSKMEHVQEEVNGRHVVRKVGMAPQQDDDLEYELNISIEMDMDHRATVAKSRADAVQVGRSFTAGHEVELAALYADWLKGGEPPAAQSVVDDLVARMNAMDPAERVACKTEFVQAFGRPDGLRESRAAEAEALVARFEDGGGGSDVPSGGSPAAPPPPVSSGGGAADSLPPAAPGESSGGERPVPPPGPLPSDVDVTGGGARPGSSTAERQPTTPSGHARDEAAGTGSTPVQGSPPSGDAPTLAQLETALHQATGRSTLPASKTAILRAAATHGHTGTYDELLADEALTLAVLADLGGTLPTGAETPPPVDLTPWKQRDEEAWDKWRRAANAKAGPGTKAKPHPRLLDEKPDYDAQRHALAFQASRRARGEGNEVTSWAELTEAECMRIWKPSAGTGALADIEGGRAVWGFTDEVVPEATGGWWLSQKAKEVAA